MEVVTNNEPSERMICGKCKKISMIRTWWEEAGTYSTKLAQCPYCKKITVIRNEDAAGLYVNTDGRYY